MKKITTIFLLLFVTSLFAQELNCNIIIDAERAQTQERQIFTQMQQEFMQFINNEHWTEDEYETHERINCSILISITQMHSMTSFSATAQVLATRTIFGTDYESTIINFPDKNFDFQYLQGVPLQFNANVFTSNITSLLAFYAYVIIGHDYDSFSKLGGSKYFEIARDITNVAASSSGSAGWRAQDGINSRYFFIDNLINSRFAPFREGLYAYHRLGMDILANKSTEAKETILKTIQDIDEVRALEPSSVLLKTYMNAKADELINIFSTGDMESKKKAAEIIKKADPTNMAKYEKITE